MPRLIANDGSQVLLQGEAVSVGRRDAAGNLAVDVDLGSLERGRTVSRRHARIFREQSAWRLRVEPSVTNETKVAGKPLKAGEEAVLSDGDEILLGAVALTFRADVDPEVTLVRQAQAPAELRSDGLAWPLAAPEGRRVWIGRPRQGTAMQPDLIDLSELAGSRSVSHLHAQVYRTPGGWMLHEGKTTNPTMVAGRELAPGEDVPLTDGISIQLGRVLVTFHEKRVARRVASDILLLEVDRQEVTIDPGKQDVLNLRLVNATGRVEQVEVAVEGFPTDWYHIVQPDGTRGTTWRVQLVPTGPDLTNPVPNSWATATLVLFPPRTPQARAGTYPISISATTRGEDMVEQVVPTRVHLLPFEGLTLTIAPAEARGASGKYTAEIVNAGNVDAAVELTLEPEPGVKLTADPQRLQLANGADQRAALKARVHHHWFGPTKTYGFHVSAAAGSQRAREGALLVCKPIIPEWLQAILSKLFSMLSPIAIPTATLVLLMGLAYLFLRPPEIKSFYASAPAVPAGGTVQLSWSGDRVSGVSIDPPLATKPDDKPEGTIDATPDKTTEYTLTLKNWVGLSSTAKTTVGVVKINSFTASANQLTQEGQEVTLKWDTDGAQTVQIDPGDEIKDPKPSGEAKVHPSGNVNYTLTAAGNGGVNVTQSIPIAIGLPSIKRFEVTDPPAGTRVFPGSQVKLNWQADGATRAVITADKGDVSPGHKELDVSAGPPTTVQPLATGDVTYTLTVSNAAGSAPPATQKITVSPLSITQFLANPDNVTSGTATNLAWQVEGANESTQISIDPGIGKVPPQGQRPVNPTDTTEYVLTVQSADGTTMQQKTTVTVKAPTPVVSVFTAPSAAVNAGDQVRLTWNIQNADSIEIRTGDNLLIVQTNQLQGSVIDIPPGPTTYILTATNASGKTTKDFSVDVKPPGATPVPTPAPNPAPAASPAPAPATKP
ncbi:MAG: FHA domain-containing protein [Chloroflexi bacterium]|nr:FHA domain-containing protein [Chloroflexota bacterium]